MLYNDSMFNAHLLYISSVKMPGYSHLWVKSRNNLDLLSHFIWAGKRVLKNKQITSFVDCFRKV